MPEQAGRSEARPDRSGRLDALADVDAVMRRLRKVRDRIQFADYGYSGMFDATKVGVEQLDELRAFDRGLGNDADGIVDLVADLAADSSSLSADIKLLGDRIDALDTRFSERDDLITGVGR